MVILLAVIIAVVVLYRLTTDPNQSMNEFNLKASKSSQCLEEGKSLLKQEKFQEALLKLEESIQVGPSNLGNREPYFYKGQCYLGVSFPQK